jgi:hypothetical protein
MSDQHLTVHAALRIAQRAIRHHDLEFIQCIGTEVEDGYLVREKDFQAFERELKRLRDHAKRLVGKRMVIAGGSIVTAYHAQPHTEKRLLRGAEGRASRD